MKTNASIAQTTFASVVLCLASVAHAAGPHGHTLAPRHGGMVVEAKDIDYELVASPKKDALYLRDHGKPVDVMQASAKLTLLSGDKKQEVELKPAGGKLQAEGSFQVGPGTRAVVVVTRPDKAPATARFSFK